MDIGGALAAARSQAGLTITQVSQRTRIREIIIRDIERDDFAKCGGDFYARGHIRAIARVVGIDPAPLIADYDAATNPPPPEPDVPGHDGLPDKRGSAKHAWGGGSHEAAAGGASHRGGPGGITAAEAFRPAMPLQIRGNRRPRRTGGLALLLLAVIGFLTYLLVSGSSNGTGNASSASHHGGATAHRTTGGTSSHSPTATPTPAAVQLTPTSAAAFGPAGTGQGDAPQLAGLAIDGSDSTAWHTDWYATSSFGGLQSGTGLLLDMGKPVAITSARIIFGAASGGAFQLRAGDAPALGSLTPVAQAADTGGTLTVPIPNPVSARYLLIWFTALPPDSTGTYQASIYDVRLTGTP